MNLLEFILLEYHQIRRHRKQELVAFQVSHRSTKIRLGDRWGSALHLLHMFLLGFLFFFLLGGTRKAGEEQELCEIKDLPQLL